MSASTPSATRFSADIELRPVKLDDPSEPTTLPSLPGTTKSSSVSLPLESLSTSSNNNANGGQASPETGSSTPTNPNTDASSSSLHDLTDPLNPQFLFPVDRGHHAWLFLLGATVIEIIIFGLPYSIGVLHLYWTNTLFPNYGASTVTLAATLQAGLLYMLTALVGPVITAYPRYTKQIQIAGLVISTIGLIASGFAKEPWHLVLTLGLLYPFAAATYVPCATILFEWFSARRGLAAGIMYAGTGVGGTIFPFIISGLISTVGYRNAMLTMGIAYGVLGGVALIPVKRRIPIPRKARGGASDDAIRRPRANFEFLKGRLVYIGFGIIVVSSLGNFIPSLWLPAYADDLHVYPSGTGLISIMNAASVPGNAIIGYLSDRFPISSVILLNCVGTALACFTLWGFGTTAGPLVAFVLIFGLLGLGFVSTWTRMISTIARDDPTMPAMIFSIFAFGKGIGSMTSGPIADQLLKVSVLKGAAGGYGINNYGILLIYTGVSILLAGGMGLAFRESKKS